MPAVRNIRRSRRLSGQSPRNYYDSDDDWEIHNLIALASEIDSASPSPSTGILSTSPPPEPDSEHQPLSEDSSVVVPPPLSSHSRRRPKNHIPRPPNAFIMFRSHFWAKQRDDPIERDHRIVSRLAGHIWRRLPAEERIPFQQLAEERKRQHALQYPDYKYTPAGRTSKGKKKKARVSDPGEKEKCRKLARLLMDGVPGSDSELAIPSSSISTPRAVASARRVTTSTRRSKAKRSRQVTPELSLKEEPDMPTLTPNSPSPDIIADSDSHSDGGFVPTSEIPPLDLSAPAVKMEQTDFKFDFLDLTVKPSSFDLVDTHFGSQSAYSYPWCAKDEDEKGAFSDDETSSVFSGTHVSDSSIDPANPFALVGLGKEPAPLVSEQIREVSDSVAALSIGKREAVSFDDKEMDEFFNFDKA